MESQNPPAPNRQPLPEIYPVGANPGTNWLVETPVAHFLGDRVRSAQLVEKLREAGISHTVLRWDGEDFVLVSQFKAPPAADTPLVITGQGACRREYTPDESQRATILEMALLAAVALLIGLSFLLIIFRHR